MMFWQEETKHDQYSIPDAVVDVAFQIGCRSLTVDHAWALSQAVCAVLPWLTEEPGYDRKFTYRDFPAEASQIAAVMYELGIAFAIGKPVVVVARQNRDLPFDVDITPVYLTDGINDLELLERGLESAIYRRQRGGEIGSIAKTIACVEAAVLVPCEPPGAHNGCHA